MKMSAFIMIANRTMQNISIQKRINKYMMGTLFWLSLLLFSNISPVRAYANVVPGMEPADPVSYHSTSSPRTAQPDKKISDIYFFYGQGCKHCAGEEIFLDKLEKEMSDIRIHRYEVWNDRENAGLLSRVAQELKLRSSGVPVLVVGDKYVVGFLDENTTGKEIRDIIRTHKNSGCVDAVAEIKAGRKVSDRIHENCGEVTAPVCRSGNTCADETDKIAPQSPEKINYPFWGEISIREMSLPLLTVIIGTLDGFNPCALWVLIFLISLLFGMNDRTRMWILGGAFLFASAAVYYLFMAAWLNIFIFIGFILWVRLAIAGIAIFSGAMNVREFWINRNGTCKVTDSDRRKATFDRLRSLALQKNFWLALSGIMLLAGAVNLVELVCSAGLPAVYTQILAASGVSGLEHYLYLLLYVFMYILQPLVIFIIAMATLKIKAVSNRYTRYIGLVGGLIMLAIGLMLIFKPGWIMFG